MDKKDFFYELPKHLIAQEPAAERTGSRLMHLCRRTGKVEHGQFINIGDFLRPGDVLVVNDSRVIPARLVGKTATGSEIELLLSERRENGDWEAMAGPGKRARVGDVLSFGDGELTAHIEEVLENGLRVVKFTHEGDFEPILEKIGQMPLPHYIETPDNETAKDRYNTVYATNDGSVAAPTAGLHFTEELLAQIAASGVIIERVTLHVGIGTFTPVKTDDITKHEMHSEYCHISEQTADRINTARAAGGRVIAIGTTSCRTLESRVTADGQITAGAGKTDIFIYPGYEFKAIDGLFTNFHLPESTLIMLVSAFAGRENVLAAYAEAVREEYRFFSYGDAMLMV